MVEVITEVENRFEGNEIVIEIEIKGELVSIIMVCPACSNRGFWLSQNHDILYCAKCRTYMGVQTESNDKIAWSV